MRHDRPQGRESPRYPAPYQFLDQRHLALERHVRHVQAARMAQIGSDQVARRAHAERTVVDLAAIPRGPVHELLHIARRYLVVDHQDQLAAGDLRDEAQVAVHVVGNLVEHVGQRQDRRRVRDQQGVAVGLGARHHVGAEHAGCPRLVLDDEGRAQPAPHFLAQGARQGIGGAARRLRHDKGDRPAGKRLGRLQRSTRQRCRQHEQGFDHGNAS